MHSPFSNPQLNNTMRWKNARVGLLGGSFNPPHKGHLYISKIALKTLQLDWVWWLVTPQNPLKSGKDLLPIDERVALSEQLIDHPKVLVTDMEQNFGTTYTYATVKAIKRNFPHTKFAWISGMDNAHNLHKWHNWQDLLEEIPMIHITRHPPVNLIKNCPVKMMANQKHITLNCGARAPLLPRRTYWVLQKPMMNISSTEIREKNKAKTKS